MIIQFHRIIQGTAVARLVLGRFWESIRKDSILLAIFAGEQEDSIQKSKNRFRIATIPTPESAKKRLKPRVLAFVHRKNSSQKLCT
jgi:truncated hemoglobin YjbI